MKRFTWFFLLLACASCLAPLRRDIRLLALESKATRALVQRVDSTYSSLQIKVVDYEKEKIRTRLDSMDDAALQDYIRSLTDPRQRPPR